MARYYDGILREDEIYKWIISAEANSACATNRRPMSWPWSWKGRASLCRSGARHRTDERWWRLPLRHPHRVHEQGQVAPAPDLAAGAGPHQHRRSHQPAQQIESFFFYSNTLGIQAKNNERLFVQWAAKLRGLKSEIAPVIETTLVPYLKDKLGEFRQRFLALRDNDYHPYRLRYVLGRMENQLLDLCNTRKRPALHRWLADRAHPAPDAARWCHSIGFGRQPQTMKAMCTGWATSPC